MGIEPFLIAYAINLVVAQRLIRTLCSQCRIVDESPDERRMRHVGFSQEQVVGNTFYTAPEAGTCVECRGTGYSGRKAITETMPFSAGIRDLIVSSNGQIHEDEIRKLAVAEGMHSLADRARELVLLGETSVDEMIRVVFTGM
jgi:type IV pilus assembly protein PilB